MKKLVSAILITLMTVSTAHAGRATLKNSSGATMKLWCNGSGCFTKQKAKGEKYGDQKRIGPGGSVNFKAQKAKFNSQGWN